MYGEYIKIYREQIWRLGCSSPLWAPISYKPCCGIPRKPVIIPGNPHKQCCEPGDLSSNSDCLLLLQWECRRGLYRGYCGIHSPSSTNKAEKQRSDKPTPVYTWHLARNVSKTQHERNPLRDQTLDITHP